MSSVTTDLLPLTGVTVFPFVSNGGSSMMRLGLLAFIKAADTRQNANAVHSAGKRKAAV